MNTRNLLASKVFHISLSILYNTKVTITEYKFIFLYHFMAEKTY